MTISFLIEGIPNRSGLLLLPIAASVHKADFGKILDLKERYSD